MIRLIRIVCALAVSLALRPASAQEPDFANTLIVDPNGSPSANHMTIQAAINAFGSSTTKKTVLIYAGTYNDVVTLDDTKENIDLIGIDRDAVTIAPTSTGHGIEITSGTETSRNNSIRNLTIKTTDGAGIKITKGGGGGDQAPADIILENVTISADGTASRGINGPDSDRVQVINCHVTTDDGVGIFVDENWIIRDTTVNSFGTAKDGIGGTSGGDSAQIINCKIDADNGEGIMPSGDGWYIQGTRVEALGTDRIGIDVTNKNNTTVRDCDSVGGDRGIYVNNSDNFQAFSSKFRGGEFGGLIFSASDNALFEDCFLFGDGTILATSPARIQGVMMDTASPSNRPSVTFKGCRIVAEEATDEVVGVDVDVANPARLIDCEIIATNTDTDDASTAYGVYTTVESGDLGAIIVGGVIRSSRPRRSRSRSSTCIAGAATRPR